MMPAARPAPTHFRKDGCSCASVLSGPWAKAPAESESSASAPRATRNARAWGGGEATNAWAPPAQRRAATTVFERRAMADAFENKQKKSGRAEDLPGLE